MRNIRSSGHRLTRRFIAGLLAAAIYGTTSLALGQTANTLPPPIRFVPGLEEPLVATDITSAADDTALDLAITSFRFPAAIPEDFSDSAKPFEAFLKAHPASPWRMAILLDLGAGYYRAGYFTNATAAWQEAWSAGRGADSSMARALADRAIGELARMHARVGHATQLESLLTDLGDRKVSGPATEMITGAREALWLFQNDWGRAYLCGPMALKNLLIAMGGDSTKISRMDEAESGPRGFNLVQVSQLADSVGFPHRLIYRTPTQPIPVPSIINWNVHHYATIVEVKNGRYHIQDPTFASGDLWVTKKAIDKETGGYFLIPGSSQIPWRMATMDEASRVYGMGKTTQNQVGATTPNDVTAHPPCTGSGMCVANAKMMVVSLNLTDTPVGYDPPIGPSARVQFTYNQREASQPSVFGFFNVGPKWTINLLSWVQDVPTSPGASVMRYVAGGGSIDYSMVGSSYDGISGAFTPEHQGQAVLVRIPATGPVTSYELQLPDGSKQVFARSDGAATAPRRLFLTRIIDPNGNALTLNYDSQLRLISLTDATRRNTSFSYGLRGNPLLITQITDPFGRSARISYDSSGRLATITDVLGLTSSFAYDDGGLINGMTTPYGTSGFAYGDGPNNTRYLEMTDPLGYTERIEFRHSAPGIPGSDPSAPAGFQDGNLRNRYLQFRNTFYWDKNVYPITHTDYTKAQLTHWLHNYLGQTSPIIESTKMPLESRVWRAYTGQGGRGYIEGTEHHPRILARLLDDNSTQSTTVIYNPLGKPSAVTDAVGRSTLYNYSENNIDLINVQQQTSVGLSAVGSYTFNDRHLPLSYVDAAGQATRYSYNSTGQIAFVTDALNQTTTFNYDGLGRRIATLNANGHTIKSQSYDGFDRVATSTDSEGLTRSIMYDSFDRPIQITYPDGTAAQFTYDKLDLGTSKDRLGRITRYRHDAARRLVFITDPMGQTTHYGYYPNGTLASITDPRGNVTKWGVDIQGRPVTKRFADGNVETYAYEVSTSRLKTKTDPLGQVKTYAYSQDDRIIGLNYANARQPTANVQYTYDSFFSRLVTMTDGIGTTRFKYHPIGTAGALRLSVENGPHSNDVVSYQYDALGRVNGRAIDVSAETFSYDRIGRTIFHGSALGSFDRAYLGQTNQLTSQLSNSGVGTQWTYDTNANDRRLIAIGNTGHARSFGYTSTAQNRIVAMAENVASTSLRTWEFTYDHIDRLVVARPSDGPFYSYRYDAADNLINVGGTGISYNSGNQISSFGTKPFTYDANGNLIEDGDRTYRWDAEDRLVSIGYKVQPDQATSLAYDGLGRRLAISEFGKFGRFETRYLWCGDELCQARNSNEVVIRRYFPEGFINPQSGQSIYYATDRIGSVRDLLATQTGSRVGAFDYDPYGTTIEAQGRVTSEFLYAGMFYHPKSGLYLTRYRPFSTITGSWLKRDPLNELVAGPNLYSYVSGNPINRVDLLGLSGITYYAGLSCSLVGATGITGTIGFYYNSQYGEIGTFYSGGGAVGVDVSGSVVVGNSTSFVGNSINTGAGLGPVGLAASYDQNGNYLGSNYAVGLGASLVSGSTGYTTTNVQRWGSLYISYLDFYNSIVQGDFH